MPSWTVRFRGEDIPYKPRVLEPTEPSKSQKLPDFWLGYDSEAAPVDEHSDEVQTMQFSDGEKERLEYIEPGNAWVHFWRMLIRSIPLDYWTPLDKRPKTIPVYCHNWSYDFDMIIRDAPDAWVRQHKQNHFYKGFEDSVRVSSLLYTLIVDGGHMIGNAPTLTVTIKWKNDQVKVRLLDTFPFFPKALGSVAKDVGLEKGERDSVIGIDWRKIPAGGSVEKDGKTITKREFEEYAKSDAKIVHALAGRIRELHKSEGLTSLAVSGAGYAVKVLVKRLNCPIYGGHGGRTAVQLSLDSFHGGRSGRNVHGFVKDVNIFDFRSSYPSIQVRLPALHSDYSFVYYHKSLPVEEFMKLAKCYYGFARVSGIERDARFPSLLSANEQGSIRPIVGEFENVPATSGEIFTGITCGGLEIHEVGECVFYVPKPGVEDVRPFEGFIERAWTRKQSFKKGAIEYDAAKIQANSGYGKMIEHRGMNEFLTDDIQVRIKTDDDEGRIEARNFFLELHPDYWHDFIIEWDEQVGKESAGTVTLRELMNTKAEFGYYAIPQYAAWITGHAHARLVILMRALDSMKWDTDSATTYFSKEEAEIRLAAITPDMLPDYIQSLTIGEDLGELDMEARKMSGVILGNKRYFLEGEVSKGSDWVPGTKDGHHGLPGIKKQDIKGVLNQESSYYKVNPKTGRRELCFTAKPRPKKIRSAKTVREVGKFYEKDIFPEFLWDEKQEHMRGEYLPFAGYGKGAI